MEKVFFKEIHGKRVFCTFSEPSTESKKLVIMSHGFRGTSVGPSREFVDFQRLLTQNNYSVLRFDQPNSGNSEGNFIDSSFAEWVWTIVYLAKKYLDQGYTVSLLGQSMGASATIVAANDPQLKDQIGCLLLWVPDPKSDVSLSPDGVYEEAGQKIKGKFWLEAKEANVLHCLQNYNGKIHVVYGEVDRYVKEEDRDKVMQIVKEKGQGVMVLKGQDHSPWEFDLAHEVYRQQLAKLNESVRK